MINRILKRLEEVEEECMSEPMDDYFFGKFKGIVKAKEIVQEVAKEYDWIPTEKALPTKRDWYLAIFKEPDTDFVLIPKVADYLMGVHTNYTTEEGWIIADCTDTETERDNYYKKLKCIAWKLIAPYQKGE